LKNRRVLKLVVSGSDCIPKKLDSAAIYLTSFYGLKPQTFYSIIFFDKLNCDNNSKINSLFL